MAQTIYPTEEEIRRAAEALRAGRLVAFPTETVYGLGANALDRDAVRRIFEVKGRPATSPLIVHVDSVETARSTVVAEWPESAAKLAERFWPGPLTLVLPKRPGIPDEVTAGLQTVGVRAPAHPVAMQLLKAAGVPVAAPSANRFTQLSPTEAQHVRDGLGDAIEFVLDGGPTNVGIESTVLSLAVDVPLLLRPGMISQADLESVIGFVSLGEATASGAHASPGLHEKHYSPSTRLLLTSNPPSGHGAYIWWNRERPAAESVRLPAEPAGYARELYGVLHSLDRLGLDFIAVEPVPDGPEWAGIRDRLSRASSR